MYTVTGSFKDGVALPDEPVQGFEGRPVLITFLDKSQEVEDGPTLEEVVAKIESSGPNREGYIPPTESLAEVLADLSIGIDVDPVEWDRDWASFEAEMKQKDLDDDRAEGRA